MYMCFKYISQSHKEHWSVYTVSYTGHQATVAIILWLNLPFISLQVFQMTGAFTVRKPLTFIENTGILSGNKIILIYFSI